MLYPTSNGTVNVGRLSGGTFQLDQCNDGSGESVYSNLDAKVAAKLAVAILRDLGYTGELQHVETLTL